MIFIKFLFTQIYDFYLKVFKEDDIPHWFATIVISIVFSAIVIDILLLYHIGFKLNTELKLSQYSAGITSFCLTLSLFIFLKKGHYKDILRESKKLSTAKKTMVSIGLIVFLILIFTTLIFCITTIRDTY